jgi:hypothetical protein
MGPYDRIWFADTLIELETRELLLSAVKPLEDVPDKDKDWHPRSNGLVLDLVHPSLYPIVYEHSQHRDKITIPRPERLSDWYRRREKVNNQYVSARFQWMPSDFRVSEDGRVKLASPYINNIHPIYHQTLVPVLENIIERAAIPLWSQVLSDLRWETRPTRLTGAVQCVWAGHDEPPSPEDTSGMSLADEVDWHLEQLELMTLPNTPEEYAGGLYKFWSEQKKVSLQGCTLQVIVKLANIILTPEKPGYGGGSWHIEGKLPVHHQSQYD